MDNQLAVTPPESSGQDMIEELRQCASILTEKLQGDQYEEASKLIESLVAHRDEYIFQAVGKLTRGLHDSIVNLNVDGGQCSIDYAKNNECEFNDASNRLNYVIEVTQNAADKTMDMVEASAPISQNMAAEASQLKEEWAKIRNHEMTVSEFKTLYERMDVFFEKMEGDTATLNENLQNIILEQGFQDLTGQVLRRVITLVTEVETSLVSLVRIAGQVEDIVGIESTSPETEGASTAPDIKGEGPQVKAEERSDVVNGQDEVDDLLSSLGF